MTVVRRAAVIVFVGVLSACGDATGTEEPSAWGFWDIWSIDGQALPLSVGFFQIQAGSLDLRANASYAFALRGTFLGEPLAETQSGQWAQTGKAVSLNPNEGCTDTAILESWDVLKITADCNESWEIVFAR